MPLGAAYEKGEVLPQPALAADLYAKVCDERQNGGACYKAGMRHYKGLDGQESKAAAAEYFKKSCDLEQISGCTNRAMMLIKGEGVPADPQAATAIFQDAPRSVPTLRPVWRGLGSREGKAGAPDIDKALRVYGSGYDQGALDGCYRGAALAISGKTGSQDFVTALGWFERGCDGDHVGSCLALGIMYEKGMGVRLDIDKAREIYDKGCKLGLKDACRKKQKLP